jgi:hypothetical protein
VEKGQATKWMSASISDSLQTRKEGKAAIADNQIDALAA